MKLLFLLSLFFITGCSTFSTKNHYISNDTCFVKWYDLKHKELYLKGLGKNRDEKSSEHLLFPLWSNGFFIVLKSREKSYEVMFEWSDQTVHQIINEIIEANFVLKDSSDLKRSMISSIFLIEKNKLHKIVKEYEEVNCQEYVESQFM